MRLPCGIITFFAHKVTLPVQIFDQKRGGEGEESGTYEAKKYGTPITISADFSKN